MLHDQFIPPEASSPAGAGRHYGGLMRELAREGAWAVLQQAQEADIESHTSTRMSICAMRRIRRAI